MFKCLNFCFELLKSGIFASYSIKVSRSMCEQLMRLFLNITLTSVSKLNPLPWSRHLSPISIKLSEWETLTQPERDTNPSQVSSQQTLVLIYLPRKGGKLSNLGQKRSSHKDSNLNWQGQDQTGDLMVGRQRSYQLRQPCPMPICLSPLTLSVPVVFIKFSQVELILFIKQVWENFVFNLQ